MFDPEKSTNADPRPGDSAHLAIDTPENVLLNAEIAGFGSRCMAAIIDYLILFAVVFFLYYSFRTTTFFRDTSTWTLAIFWLVQFALITFYHLVLEFLWNGQSLGKRALGLRVIMANGLPLTTNATLIRNLLRLFDFFPVFYCVGLVVMFFSQRSQRLGDLVAGTVVVRESKVVTLESAREDLTVHYRYHSRLTPVPANIQIDGLTPDDRRLIVSYLQRRNLDRFSPDDGIARTIAERIAKRMANFSTANLLPYRGQYELFLEQVARAFELAATQGSAVQPAEARKKVPEDSTPISPF